ncbi:beta-1,2-xylosyltransferase XYXT1-like isoform X1 [Triticum dicoccoides]|uniref:beta-1,2-xylosyltransferase XYXT1-like isoform X1 n=1 Tax=Triticum dicoccoides TaxID=85692 RepID=UPI00189069BE|nr:beta-1,2-xylosyltransferase XYXT1-like isoform X1 [Triticum dicoccoides]
MAASSSSATALAVKGVARTLAHRRQAVVGFLFALIVILVLHTTVVFGPFQSTNANVVLESTSGEQNAKTSSPLAAQAASAPNNSTQAAVHAIENGQKDDVAKNDRETRGQLGQTGKNDASDDKTQEELIRQELDRDVKRGAPRKPICDLSDPRYDICEITGDARAIGANRTVLYVPPADERGTDGPEWAIKDQSRKQLGDIKEVNVKTLSAAQSLVAPECTSRHTVPAVVFAMNGIIGNPWHDLSDLLIPLFITTRAYDGEVQFLVTELQPWFVDKYRLVLTNLSRYDIIDFNKDAGVRCYPHIIVGLRSHGDLDIDPARTPRNYTLLDFRLYIRDVFLLPSDDRGIPYKEASKKNAAGNDNGTAVTENPKPRLLLINRGESRKFVNLPEVSAAVEAAGFELLVMEPSRDMGMEEFARAVDSCDVLMGVHGAALTNFFFLRTNAVLLQVVGLGLEREALHYYGNQATAVMVQHIQYFISAEESTLYEKYGKDHPAVSDPDSVHKQGWQGAKRYFWAEQDIRLNVTRFAPTLHQLIRTLQE